jgi:hypothetical protein
MRHSNNFAASRRLAALTIAKGGSILKAMFAVILAASLLSAPSVRAQTTTQSAPRQHSRGGGRSGSGRGGANGGGASSSMKALSCPKGFRAETSPGPHLVASQSMMSSAGRSRQSRGGAAMQKPSTGASAFGRRCVPIAATKPAASPAAVAKATTADDPALAPPGGAAR